MAYNFKPFDRDQPFLLPQSLRDWLPEDHLAWFVVDAVAALDLEPFLRSYRDDGWGRAAYHPQAMLSLLVYGYCVGERSSRRIERLAQTDGGFRVVSANQMPDHSSIARFRKKHETALIDLFVEVLGLCGKAGMLKVGTVAIDGTKIKANAALEANRTGSWLREKVSEMVREAEIVDLAENARYGKKRGDELPKGMRSSAARQARFRELIQEVEQRPAPKARGRQAKKAKAEAGPETEGKAEPEPKVNLTDPDSRILKGRHGFVQGYNAQAMVTENHFVLAAHVAKASNDVRQLHPMISLAKRNLRFIGSEDAIQTALADAGYWSKLNARWEERCGVRLLIATRKVYRLRQLARLKPPRGRKPKGLSLKAQMERRLLTQEGQALYKLRGQTVEPFFGTTKDARRCDRFLRRGYYAAQSEWHLICATHNLLRLWRLTRKAA